MGDHRWKIKRLLSPAGVSAALAGLVMGICLRNDFVYDDIWLLNLDDRLADPTQWGRYWTESYNGGIDNLYRPLVSMSFAAQWVLHGLAPTWPWFAVNIALHAGASALVALLAGRFASDRTASLAAGATFATLPVHAEVVASIAGRGESMCAVFFLGAMLLAMRPMTVARAVAVWACAVGALLSKEQGLLLPAVLLAQHVLLRNRSAETGARRGNVALLLLLCWTWAGYIVLRENLLKFWWDRGLLDPMQQPMLWSHGADRALMPLVLLGHYARAVLFPAKLSLDWGGQVIGWTVDRADPHLWLGAGAAGAWVFAVAWAAQRRRRFELLLLLCLGATYLLIGNVLTLIGTNFGERLIYLPSAFLCVLVGGGIARLGRAPALVLLGIVCIAGAARTIAYVRLFDDRLRLYAASVETQPQSVRLRMLLASELLSRGELDAARAAADAAVTVQPDYHEAYLMAAVVAIEQGKLDEAEALLLTGLDAPTLKNPAKLAGYLTRVRDLRSATQPAP